MTIGEHYARLRAEQPANRRAAALAVAPVECADGFRMSVQAGRWHYCIPRDDDGPYTHYEVGFPSAREEILMPYCEDEERPTETVYGRVPANVIDAVIVKHGGLKP